MKRMYKILVGILNRFRQRKYSVGPFHLTLNGKKIAEISGYWKSRGRVTIDDTVGLKWSSEQDV